MKEIYRTFVYEFLSMGFSYPERALLEALEHGLDDLDQALTGLSIRYDGALLKAALTEAQGDLLGLKGTYNTLFATNLDVPAWETAYELDKTVRRVAELADIEGFYRAFGVQLSAPMEPDSLVAELEFLAVLLQKQVNAYQSGDHEGVKICKEAAEHFLTDHLGRWYEVFTIRLMEAAQTRSYYCELGRLLRAFLDFETTELPKRRVVLSGHISKECSQGCSWACAT